jgi:hypothetical protein
VRVAAAQRLGGNVTWLQQYWPVLEQWGGYLETELPFTGNQ